MGSWFSKCMPMVKEVKKHLNDIIKDFRKIAGVKEVYVWGSYADHEKDDSFRVRDIDIIAKTNFNSEDLISIDENILKKSLSNIELENLGYDPKTILFSQRFLDLSKYNIDHWVVSGDKKLLHWGPIPINKNEFLDMSKQAEEYAVKETGIIRKRINKTSEVCRKKWCQSYSKYFNKFFSDMPTGWYKIEDVKIKDIFEKAKKI